MPVCLFLSSHKSACPSDASNFLFFSIIILTACQASLCSSTEYVCSNFLLPVNFSIRCMLTVLVLISRLPFILPAFHSVRPAFPNSWLFLVAVFCTVSIP